MVAACSPGPLGVRDRALLVLGVAMMGRRSELAGLDLADVVEVDEGLLVYVRRSKTDQDAVGAEVAVPYGSHPDTCPVRAVRAWRALLTERGIVDGPLLRAVDRTGRIAARRMSGDGINRVVRAAAIRAGLPGADRYTAHSLRAGGVTVAAKAGAQVAAIAAQGRWSLTSPVLLGYIRAADRWRDNPMAGAL
jgi:integrase